MRKLLIVISFLAFIACLVVGFFLAQKSLDAASLSSEPVAINRSVSPFQQNILLIHVDQLDSDQPKLVSVWGLIVYFPDPKLIFQPIIPNPYETQSTLPEFSLTASKSPSSKFLRQITQQTEMNWDNFVVFDHQALSLLVAELLVTENLTVEDPSAGVIAVEKVYLLKLCQQFIGLGDAAFQQIDWRHLIPEHWRSNLSMDETLVNWKKLQITGKPPRCEVFGE